MKRRWNFRVTPKREKERKKNWIKKNPTLPHARVCACVRVLSACISSLIAVGKHVQQLIQLKLTATRSKTNTNKLYFSKRKHLKILIISTNDLFRSHNKKIFCFLILRHSMMAQTLRKRSGQYLIFSKRILFFLF